MQTFDASSLIYAWDNYPLEVFPPLWRWMSDQIADEKFTIPQVAFEEVVAKTPECGNYVRDAGIKRLPVTPEIIQMAMQIKQLLGIANDDYRPKGVGENDILIIATAAVEKIELVSNEAQQAIPPDVDANRKIPSVCAMVDVGVRCISFIEMIRTSGQVFGR